MNKLATLDWMIILGFLIFSLIIGIWTSKTSGKSTKEFFLSGRNLPWWMLGISMVATTFSADTPNLVTDIVRQNGISGNWVWWAFLLTGMLTVFIYAKFWRRSEVLTDLAFYELRYSGKEALFLRGFRAFYLGVVFNVLVMATVCLAAIKIGTVMLGLTPFQTIVISSFITVIYASLGGLKGIVLTDIFQFVLAMIGTILAAIFIIKMPEIGGLSNLLSHPNVQSKLDFVPSLNDSKNLWSLLIIPLAVQWWASYYPGSEPGGGGYIAQRMLAAKNENHAVAATFLYNIAHYALRPWPWILIALASLIIYPDIASLQAAFPSIDPSLVKDDLAYPAMMNFLPTGLIGVILASLIAAFMSTISTHLNWGASYMTHDLYHRFVNQEASEKQLIRVARSSTVILMGLAMTVALFLQNALAAFDIIILIGAGTGLIFILRWFWWRINAYSEISAMISSFIVAFVLKSFFEQYSDFHLIINVLVTSFIWISVTFMTRATDEKVLVDFYNKIQPFKNGWKSVIQRNNLTSTDISSQTAIYAVGAMILGSILVYACLFGIGHLIMGRTIPSIISLICISLSTFLLIKCWKKIESK